MNRSVLSIGALVVLLVLLLDLAGVFKPFDARTRDLQQQHVAREHAPMTSDIVHVDIDDGALQRIGRWPWPRSLLAGCIETLGDAGARTIAVDLELSEPSSDVDDDAFLADALQGRAVLALLVQADDVQQQWLDSGGSTQGMELVRTRLREDIDLHPEDLAGDLASADLVAFTASELALKRSILWEDPGTDLPTGFAEQSLQAAYARQHMAESIAARRELLDGASSVEGSPMDRLPLPELVSTAGGLGYVNISMRDGDGVVRSIQPVQSTRAGSATSLGAAAALHYLGQDHPHAAAFKVYDRVLDIQGVIVLPMHEGSLPLAWPYTEHGTGWQHLLRNSPADLVSTGHISIAGIAELVQARQLQESNRVELASISLDLLRVVRQDGDFNTPDPMSSTLQAEIADEYEFTLGDLEDSGELDEVFEDPDALEHARALAAWNGLTESIISNDAEIQQVEQALHEQVDGKLVFLGWTATGSIADFVPTVAGPRTPGVVVHAAVANMIMTGHSHLHAPRWLGPLLVILLGGWVVVLVASTTPWTSTAGSLVLLGIYVYLATMLSFASWELFLPIVAPTTSGLSAWAACTGMNAILIQRDKRRITRQFRARVSDSLVDTLIDNPSALSMAGQKREITVLFADLAGFTSISEQLGSERTVALANTSLSAMSSAIVEHDGYVNKFLGDGLMAFWSAFEPQADQAKLACDAAIACQASLEAVNMNSDVQLGLRLGIATGEAIVGDCGAPPDLNDYTAIGNTVNLAARLESANKQLGTTILVDASTRAQADGAARTLPIGPVVVVGQTQPVALHAIVGSNVTDDEIAAATALQEAVTSGDRAGAQAALEAMGDHRSLDALAVLWAEVIDGNGDLVLQLASK